MIKQMKNEQRISNIALIKKGLIGYNLINIVVS